MQTRGIPVVLGSDAHQPERVGDQFEKALDLRKAVGYKKVSHYLGRERFDVDIDIARHSLIPNTSWQDLLF